MLYYFSLVSRLTSHPVDFRVDLTDTSKGNWFNLKRVRNVFQKILLKIKFSFSLFRQDNLGKISVIFTFSQEKDSRDVQRFDIPSSVTHRGHPSRLLDVCLKRCREITFGVKSTIVNSTLLIHSETSRGVLNSSRSRWIKRPGSYITFTT